MNIWHSIILGIVQGVTEFLPISSDGHLILSEYWLGLNALSPEFKAFEIWLHGGTLLALLIYFARDWWQILSGSVRYLFGDTTVENIKYIQLFGLLIVATIPGAIAGVFLGDYIDDNFRTVIVISTMMLVMGIFFLLAEWYPAEKNASESTFFRALLIGCAQAFALLPGVSRSGMTIGTGMLLGTNRTNAARFSFLMAVPIIFGANLFMIKKIWDGTMSMPPVQIALTGFVVSLIVGLMSIKLLLHLVKKYSLKMFSLYLILLAAIIYGVLVNGNLQFIKQFIIDFFIPFFQTFGYGVVLLCAFVEAIPLLGIIIPGGTIIILSGVFALEANLSIYWLIAFSAIGAILGDFTGYFIGRKYGEEILTKYGPMIGFKEEYLYVTHRFCHQFGGYALIIGRFNNIVRPFVPMVIGSSKMKLVSFSIYNLIGGVAWSCFSVLIGFFARQSWEVIQTYVGLTGGIIFSLIIVGAVLLIRYEVKKLRARRCKLGIKKGESNNTETKNAV